MIFRRSRGAFDGRRRHWQTSQLLAAPLKEQFVPSRSQADEYLSYAPDGAKKEISLPR
ncbi:hypothetical protein PT277_03445 [Acetobacteraceae bacterium ESL0709]|nr:hypothetical protein [Acetobacteraceae bacterium ESL0709]